MTINAGNITAVMAVLALAVTLLAAVGSGIYQLGQLNSRVDHLAVEVERLSAVVEQLPTHDETRILVSEEVREEIRRSNQQLLHSLANHTHDADGQALFTVPPGSEPRSENQPQ